MDPWLKNYLEEYQAKISGLNMTAELRGMDELDREERLDIADDNERDRHDNYPREPLPRWPI